MSCRNYILLDEIVETNSGFDDELKLEYIELVHASGTVDEVRIAGTKEQLWKLANDILLVATFSPAPGSREAGRRQQ